jgi:hypothetical protein
MRVLPSCKTIVASSTLLLLCGAIWSANAGPCLDENSVVTNNGQCWRALPAPQKSAIVQGIWVGQQVQATTLQMTGDTGTVWFGTDWASVPPDTSVGDIMDYFDKLYETPANRKIEWHNAYLLAALFMRDDDENDRLSLLTFFRSNGELPTDGKIVGVKSTNVLQIESKDKTFDVRLDRVVVPDSMKSKAEAFLKGLRFGAYGGKCDTPKPTPVSLYYGTELFDDQGRLTADVRISSSVDICVGGKPVPLEQGDYSFTNIGYYLIAHGLAEKDPRIDPKWSDDRKGFDTDYSKNAREAKLYMFGDQTDLRIEVISGTVPPDTF